MNKKLCCAMTVALLGIGITVAQAAPINLITNGGFEGGFTGWSSTANSNGAWYLDDNNGSTPLSGHTTVGAASGNYYAVTDQTDTNVSALWQFVTLPSLADQLILSFDMFVNDWSNVGPIINPAGLALAAGANQYARVDIMTAGFSAFDTNTSSVLANLYSGVSTGADPNPYRHYTFDLTALANNLVSQNQLSFAVRFAQVDNQSFLNQGVDNVAVNFTAHNVATTVPEPGSLALLGLGMTGLAFARRRKATR